MELVIANSKISLTESLDVSDIRIFSAFCTGITIGMHDHICVPKFACVVSVSTMSKDTFTFSAQNENFKVSLSVSPVNNDNDMFSVVRAELLLH
jgi:hypothetical protein